MATPFSDLLVNTLKIENKVKLQTSGCTTSPKCRRIMWNLVAKFSAQTHHKDKTFWNAFCKCIHNSVHVIHVMLKKCLLYSATDFCIQLQCIVLLLKTDSPNSPKPSTSGGINRHSLYHVMPTIISDLHTIYIYNYFFVLHFYISIFSLRLAVGIFLLDLIIYFPFPDQLKHVFKTADISRINTTI